MAVAVFRRVRRSCSNTPHHRHRPQGEMHRLKGDDQIHRARHADLRSGAVRLFCAGQIGYSEALAHADSANDLRLLIKLSGREQLGAGTLDNVTLDE